MSPLHSDKRNTVSVCTHSSWYFKSLVLYVVFDQNLELVEVTNIVSKFKFRLRICYEDNKTIKNTSYVKYDTYDTLIHHIFVSFYGDLCSILHANVITDKNKQDLRL